MSKLIENGDGFVELKEDGTYIEHNVKIIQSGPHIMRIDRDSTGKETPTIIKSKLLMTVNAITGEILSEQRGFSAAREILGPPPHPVSNLDYIEIEEDTLPDDYRIKEPGTNISKVNYFYDKALKKLTRKS